MKSWKMKLQEKEMLVKDFSAQFIKNQASSPSDFSERYSILLMHWNLVTSLKDETPGRAGALMGRDEISDNTIWNF